MTHRRQVSCFTAILLSCLMLFNSMPLYAVGDGVTAICDEAYYATTDYYGNLLEGSVVKSYAMNGVSSLTDYGIYDEINNLTDATEAVTEEGKVTFDFSGGTVPKHFYFEGKTAVPFEQLPWTFSVRYTLNGVPVKAEELAGKTGVVEIIVDALPNEKASEYARNNYILLATAIFNQDDILSLEAPGAQVQLVGNLRTVIFVGFPGEEEHYVIRVGSEDFAFGGLTFMIMPATISQLDKIAEISKRKGDLEKNYDLLSDSLDNLLDSVSNISGSLNDVADGLDQLDKARGTFSEGKGQIYEDTDIMKENLTGLSQVITSIVQRAESLSQFVADSKQTVNSLTDNVVALKDALADLEEAFEDMDDENIFWDIGNSLAAVERALYGMESASYRLKNTPASKESYEGQLEKVISLHDIYSSPDFPTFLAKMLILKGAAKDAAEAASMVANIIPLLSLDETMVPDEFKGIWALAQQLNYLYSSLGSMTFEQFCLQILTSQGMAADKAADTARTMDQIYTIYSGSGDEGARDRATLEMLLQSLDSVSQTVDKTKNDLLTPTAEVLYTTGALCDDLGDLMRIIDNNDLAASGEAAAQKAQKILENIDSLRKLLNNYEPTLQAAIRNLQTASTTSVKTLNDMEKLLDDTENLLKSLGTDLDEGTKKTLESLAASLRATANSLGATDKVRAAKNNISSIIEDTWTEYTGKTNNLLMMDSTAGMVSLTDSRNPSPQSIQVLIRTQKIKAESAQNEEFSKNEVTQTTFWQRLTQMFRDIWLAIKGLFQ